MYIISETPPLIENEFAKKEKFKQKFQESTE